ncbi:36801_t:CDS:2 [Racocetra persica]|uniref:36801_t:CDS:1 n=1 Tax=Racocetra persica TaxID=160502 RepID=A0ACA9KBM7_9GLOM|nr:36801_t:CDS:2 [Racocetra persica]
MTIFSEEGNLGEARPVTGLIVAQEEEYQPISDLFDYYYENRSCSNIKYNIREVEDDQRKQLFKLLKNHSDSCAQDISELGQTDIIQHHIPTQDICVQNCIKKSSVYTLRITTTTVEFLDNQGNQVQIEYASELVEGDRIPLYIEDLHKLGDPAKDLTNLKDKTGTNKWIICVFESSFVG